MRPISFKSRFWLYALLALAAVIFLLCRERQLSGFDPANFVLAIKYGYSVAQERPHVPGYPGFYLLWKGIEFVTSLSPHEVILEANLLFLLCALLLTYYGAKRLFDERTALLTTALVLTNPLLLYFACTTELYVYDAAFSAFLVVMLLAPPKRHETAFYFVYGLLGAFRLSSVVLTFPVIVVILLIRYRKTKTLQPTIRYLLAITFGTLAWLVPFIINIGGWHKFLGVLNGAAYLPTTLAQNISTFLQFNLWMSNILLIVVVLSWKRIFASVRRSDEKYIVLALLIFVPGLFFVFKYYAKGDALIYLAPFDLICAKLIVQSTRRSYWVISALGVNLLIFFAVPFKAPSVPSILSHANRTMTERWSTALWRSTSFYAPTFAHLRTNDRVMEISKEMLNNIQAGSYVIVDGAAAAWAYPRSLQVEHPLIAFLMPRSDVSPTFKLFYRDSKSENFKLTQIPSASKLYYLTTTEFVSEVGAPPGNVELRIDPFELFFETLRGRDSISTYLASPSFRNKP